MTMPRNTRVKEVCVSVSACLPTACTKGCKHIVQSILEGIQLQLGQRTSVSTLPECGVFCVFVGVIFERKRCTVQINFRHFLII